MVLGDDPDAAGKMADFIIGVRRAASGDGVDVTPVDPDDHDGPTE